MWPGSFFGDARTSRAVVTRLNDGAPPEGPRRPLDTDHAVVGALRRGGVLGGLAFLFGVRLLVGHAVVRRPAAWFTIAALSMVPPIVTEDWLLGGTNGVLWLLLLTGEAWVTRPSCHGWFVGRGVGGRIGRGRCRVGLMTVVDLPRRFVGVDHGAARPWGGRVAGFGDGLGGLGGPGRA